MLADKSLLHSRHFSKLSSLDKYFSPKKTRDKLLCIEGPSKTKVVLYTILTQAKIAKKKDNFIQAFSWYCLKQSTETKLQWHTGKKIIVGYPGIIVFDKVKDVGRH